MMRQRSIKAVEAPGLKVSVKLEEELAVGAVSAVFQSVLKVLQGWVQEVLAALPGLLHSESKVVRRVLMVVGVFH
jgi:hypothetical protein